MISQLVYVSSAVTPLRPDDLAEILEASRRNNTPIGITGALLYAGGNVMQALEGPAEAVEATFRRVEVDPRHRGVMVLYRGEAEERSFPDWSMGVRTVEELPAESREGVQSLFDLAEPAPDRARRLLSTFCTVAG